MIRRSAQALLAAGGSRIVFGKTSTCALSSASDAFGAAQTNLKKLREEPDSSVKLELYALFKQASSGDVSGKRPGALDFVGKAKYDAWSNVKGISKEEAMSRYAKLVESLLSAEGPAAAASTDSASGQVNGLKVHTEGKVSRIEINRPAKLNSITWEMYEGIIDALKRAGEDKSTSVTVFTGMGEYFSSGNDLSNFAKISSPADVAKLAALGKDVLKRYVAAFIDHPKPLIALVNGPAIGISVTVLGMFDLVLASDKATFVTPFAALGQSPEGCSSFTFPMIMGTPKAAEFLLFGKKLSAKEACDRNLVNEVFPDGVFRAETEKRITAYSLLPPQSLQLSKGLLRSMLKDELHKCNEREVTLLAERWQSQECANAIQNFFKRK
uniref:ACB domain-containing protein n=1 Tax=Plectus sambesii TaxID=2011161 RepID=A0A914WKY6_9BILA